MGSPTSRTIPHVSIWPPRSGITAAGMLGRCSVDPFWMRGREMGDSPLTGGLWGRFLFCWPLVSSTMSFGPPGYSCMGRKRRRGKEGQEEEEEPLALRIPSGTGTFRLSPASPGCATPEPSESPAPR